MEPQSAEDHQNATSSAPLMAWIDDDCKGTPPRLLESIAKQASEQQHVEPGKAGALGQGLIGSNHE